MTEPDGKLKSLPVTVFDRVTQPRRSLMDSSQASQSLYFIGSRNYDRAVWEAQEPLSHCILSGDAATTEPDGKLPGLPITVFYRVTQL